MRICHLGKFYPPAAGGMETHVRTLAQAQAALGASVRVVCINHRGPRGDDMTWKPFQATDEVRERDGLVRVTRLGRWRSIARLELSPAVGSLIRRLDNDGLDVIHLHVPNPTMLLAVAACRVRTPLVISYHSDVVRQKALAIALRPIERRVFARAACILSDSANYAAGSPILRRYAAKVTVLPMGIDCTPYVEPSAAAQAYADNLQNRCGFPLWLAVGRLVYYKALHIALEALVHVPGKLLIVGKGPLEPSLRRLASQLGVADRVVWQGHANRQELIGAYHAATALWFPSNAKSESFGLVQVEAMASGCPVINAAIPTSGVPWVSQHEESGLTVPTNDSMALARAALRLLNEPGLRCRLALAARERALTQFDHRVMAQRSLTICEDVLGRPRMRVLTRSAA